MVKTVDALVLDTIDELEGLAGHLPDHLVIDRNRMESNDNPGFRTVKDLMYTAARLLRAYNVQYVLTENDMALAEEVCRSDR